MSDPHPVSPASSRQPIYSYRWAASVIKRARESHVRGWEILDPLLGLSERQLAFLIACNDPTWPQIRDIVHKAERWDARQRSVGPSPLKWTREDYRMLIVRECKSIVKSLGDYLTGRLENLML